MDGDVSINLPDESSLTFMSEQVNNNDPLDVASLVDFEDEAALINDLLMSESRGSNGDINNSFNDTSLSSSNIPLPELDVKLARLLGVLEHACQDTSAQVERAIEEVSRTVPRLTFDLQLMRENVVLLRFTLDSIRKRSIEATAHSETSQVMRRLKVLDTIKTRMEAARDVLREAEAWSTLESEVTALVQEQSYAKAAERLAEANKSMVVFQNSPEYEQRRSLMVSLQNGLEAGLSASLVTAINARDTNACKNFYAIFGQIQRETEFRNYYFGSRRAHLLTDWQHARLSDCPSATTDSSETLAVTSRPTSPAPPVPFSSYLPNFYARLQNSLNEERTQIPSIFPDPLDTLSAFLQSTVDSLVPSLPQRISDLSNSHGPRLLTELIKIYHSTEEFAIAVDRIFSRLSSSLAPPTPAGGLPSPTTPQRGSISSEAQPNTPGGGPPSSALKRVRRQSKAMSISRRHSRGGLSAFGGVNHLNGSASPHGRMSIAETSEPVRAWETSLFEPFLDWQAEYADLETRLLNHEIARLTAGQDATAYLLSSASISSDDQDDDNESTSSSSASQRKNVAKILLDQTLSVFTLAEEAMGRCMALTHGYGAAAYVEAVDMVFRNYLHKERDTLTRAIDVRTRRRRAPTAGGADRDGSIEYSQEDWATFQLALRLLDASRTIWDRISALEAKVTTRLIDVAGLMKEARLDPLSQVVPGTCKGALVLLWQSTLNSASLNSLLDSIDQHHSNLQAGPAPTLFTKARAASIDLTRASQSFLHNTILAPLIQALEKYPNLAVWSQPSDSRQENRGAAFDLHIPTFSLSPSETITHVGEGLFNLPGLFEVYAEDDALGFSLDTLPGLDAETVRQLRKEHSQSAGVGIGNAPLPSPQHVMNRHGHRMSIVGNEFLPSKTAEQQQQQNTQQQQPQRPSPSISHHSSYSLSSPAGTTSGQEQQQTERLSAELVISTWLSALTRSVLQHLVKEALPSIRYLSKHGEAQLASDLAYISNVAKALDVGLEELESWKLALEGGDKAAEADDGEQNGGPAVNPEIIEMIRRMRLRPVQMRNER
ncbi:hypothetical protein P389DRAFT_55872 [Cystobasidium minutum MCA 4210]|uniref:uncharacterized protein n=1 Tax=Cystobasidium minutum MCA 4210 TaxID=1397322 RepID=UPI0034CF6CAB|eukprot:jgi/Rhomi1/55872/CE55871_471